MYNVKLIFHAERPRDYADGLLSLAYIPNIVVMTDIVTKHATSTRKDDGKYYGKGDKERNIFNPSIAKVADQKDQYNAQITKNDHLQACLFHGFLNKSEGKPKLALKVIHIQLLVAKSICASSINFMKKYDLQN